MRSAVATVAGANAAEHRRLTQVISQRPQVFVGGQSSAPVVVGKLLLASRQAGLTAVSAPRWAACGEGLVRNMWRCGGHWLPAGYMATHRRGHGRGGLRGYHTASGPVRHDSLPDAEGPLG